MPHIDLLELPYFLDIGLSDVVSLIDAMTPKAFGAGDALVQQADDTVLPLYIVTHGSVAIYAHAPDKQHKKLLAQHTAPTIIGEIELFLGGPAVASATATTPVSTFCLAPKTFLALRQKAHPALLPFVINIAKVACQRLKAADLTLTHLL